MTRPVRRVVIAATAAALLTSACVRPDDTSDLPSVLPTIGIGDGPTSADTGNPARPGGGTSQRDMVDDMPGPSDGSCVDVSGRRSVRSGDFGVGDFVAARAQYKDVAKPGATVEIGLNVIPATPGSMAGLSWTLDKMRGIPRHYDGTTTTTAQAGGIKYYHLALEIPARGVWRLKLASGAAKGCFDVAFAMSDQN